MAEILVQVSPVSPQNMHLEPIDINLFQVAKAMSLIALPLTFVGRTWQSCRRVCSIVFPICKAIGLMWTVCILNCKTQTWFLIWTSWTFNIWISFYQVSMPSVIFISGDMFPTWRLKNPLATRSLPLRTRPILFTAARHIRLTAATLASPSVAVFAWRSQNNTVVDVKSIGMLLQVHILISYDILILMKSKCYAWTPQVCSVGMPCLDGFCSVPLW